MSGAIPPRTSSPNRHQSETPFNARNAALQGASSAFSAKPPVKPKPKISVADTSQGALLAATRVGTGGDSTPQRQAPLSNHPLTPQSTGGAVRKRWSQASLDVPNDATSNRSLSPSNLAANIAAARFSPQPPSQKPPLSQHARNLSQPPQRPTGETARSASRVSESPPKATDTSSIPPTNALVRMFEKTDSQTSPRPAGANKPSRNPEPPSVKSPTPLRRTGPKFIGSTPGTIGQVEVARTVLPAGSHDSPRHGAPKFRASTANILDLGDGAGDSVASRTSGLVPMDAPDSTKQSVSVPSNVASTKKDHPAQPLEDRGGRINESIGITKGQALDSTQSLPLKLPGPPKTNDKPAPPHPRRGRALEKGDGSVPPLPRPPKLETGSSSPSTYDRSPPRSIGRSSIDPSGRSTYQRESIRQITPHITGDSLANAMVAGALASSRPASVAPTPTRSPAPYSLPWNQSAAHVVTPFTSRTPSPGKGLSQPSKSKPTNMRKTLRKTASSSSDDERSKRTRKPGFLQRKHPNKHHEGDRKRWRDTITPREKKRYEGVWAANRGLWLTPDSNPRDDGSDDVANIVVRELWNRSRLPTHVLEEVWDLVDSRGVGRLSKHEFVVGLWLVDQRLKGRKLPPKVIPSVWSSVKGVGAQVRLNA